ncbi:MAG TPA: cytochrome P450 [Acidimicrobiales bacterium]|nr:cytochrome P450 [Acidimicrobiales bacterium]
MAQRTVQPIDEYPIGAPDGAPFALLSQLREHAPVALLGDGRYFVTRYEDVLDALRRIDEFVGSMRDPEVRVPTDQMLLIEMAEPRHGRIRRFFNTGVSKARVAQLEPWIRSLCEDAIDRILVRSGPTDLAAAYVRSMPTSVIARLVGASADDHEQIAAWVDELSNSEYLSRNRGPLGVGLEHGFPDFYRYLHEMVTTRRADAEADDFIAQLIRTEVDGTRLSDNEILAIVALMLQAGSETTRHLLANILVHVANEPSTLDDLHQDKTLVAGFVEEMLRLYPPVTVLLRNVASGTDLGGCPFTGAGKALLSISSANRDDAVFEGPDELRLGRPNGLSHLAFGGGPHVCPGAALARLEARVATDVLVERVRRIELDPQWRYRAVPVFWANGPVDVVGTMMARGDAR